MRHGNVASVSTVLPHDEYIASLARKRMGAMALFRDDDDRVLIVNPTYKGEWLLPGGSVEADESPHAACRREVLEEIGLDRPPGRIVAVDWIPTQPDWPEGLLLVYDGGMLSQRDIQDIVVDGEEISEFRFVAPAAVPSLLSPRSSRRISACLAALRTGETLSLEDGNPHVTVPVL
jgi:8-oxo-dGTP diphosphatase